MITTAVALIPGGDEAAREGKLALPKVIGLLRRGETDPEPRAARVSRHNRQAHEGVPLIDRFSAALESRPKGRAGSFVLVPRDADLEGWRQIVPILSLTLEHEISRKLRPGDVMENASEGKYVVLFSSSEPSTTQTQSDQIFRAFKAAAAKHHSGTPAGLTGFVGEYDAQKIKEQEGAPAVALIDHLARAEQESRRVAEEERTARLNARKVHYSPVAHSRKTVAVFSRCELEGDAPQEQFASLGGMQSQGPSSVSRSEFDALLLKKAIAGYGTQLRAVGAPLALVPVNLSTLQSAASTDHYLPLLAAMPEQYRKLLMIEIAGLPVGWTASEIASAVVLLSQFAKRVVVQLPLDTRHLEAVGQFGSWAISVDLSGCRSTNARLPGLLGQFTNAAFACGMNSIAYGIDSTGLAALARNAGFVFLSGSAAQPDAAQSAIGKKGR